MEMGRNGTEKMNFILKLGIVWVMTSAILVRLVPNPENTYLVCLIGCSLIAVGAIVNEYQALKWEERVFE
jgi:hypothetical protein